MPGLTIKIILEMTALSVIFELVLLQIADSFAGTPKVLRAKVLLESLGSTSIV